MSEESESDYFVGRLSPFILFEFEYHSLDQVVSSFEGKPIFDKDNPVAEVCLIGIVAHFEAFCKHLFAAAANISPISLQQFADKRPEVALKLTDILSLPNAIIHSLGFLVADHYDFGSPQKVNGLFRDLLDITPFSRDEIGTYESILRTRHLLVHHGGIFTLAYTREAAHGAVRAYKDGVRLGHDEYVKDADFLFQMALKMTQAASKSVRSRLTDQDLADAKKQHAITALLTAVYDSLE